MIDLIKYLPDEYINSQIMRSIMEIDAEMLVESDELVKCLFATTCPDAALPYWLAEYDAADYDELLGKLRGGKGLTKETLVS